MKLSIKTSIAALFLSASSLTIAAPQYVITTDIAKFTGTALNDSGIVIGTLGNTVVGAMYDGTTHTLSSPTGDYVYPAAINASGNIVGYFSANGGSRAFMYDGTMHDLGLIPGTMHTTASNINALGQIVGQSKTSSGVKGGFLYDNGVMYDLGTMVNADVGGATSINDKGQITGWVRNPGGGQSGFLYDTVSQTFTIIGGLGGTNDINDNGVIAGFLPSTTPPVTGSGAVYNGTTVQSVGPLAGNTISFASAINNEGLIVGRSGFLGSPIPTHAMLYDGSTSYDLNSLLLSGDGIVLKSAVDINEAGQILALGTDGHTYVLTPVPLPASLWLLGSTMIGLTGFTRRKR